MFAFVCMSWARCGIHLGGRIAEESLLYSSSPPNFVFLCYAKGNMDLSCRTHVVPLLCTNFRFMSTQRSPTLTLSGTRTHDVLIIQEVLTFAVQTCFRGDTSQIKPSKFDLTQPPPAPVLPMAPTAVDFPDEEPRLPGVRK